ncbi:patatin-like phospholipase family protein [Formosa sp. PL04]|uniref:patatin-like phospholipase family protein n=1 Tax=Formosa sp. PL04 TaxID=3081755 RepID=UPI002981A6BE|nr:patatin-like phospholipase family protein [Formosa sp. PL04]MDW5288925.1 patatin-like phospholipase family protein [Formosa sp. PL04]
MKKLLKLSFLLSCILLSNVAQAQEDAKEKPKVALVLSGGGALGIAHIPLLQKLDSLGIVPDLVVGTSMGTIVGALYSIGYSGNQIAEIAETADWVTLFGGKVSVNDVSNEEKSEFERFSVGFEVIDKKPKPVLAILNDQNLREFFQTITYPVYNVNSFDDYAIPFRAMATDIVFGKQVILDEGSLAIAMRSSMSIPGVFAPVEYKNTLLVDGGVLNNFAVDVAIDWGADFIIGSEVSGGLQTKEQLNSLPNLMFQTGMLSSSLLDAAHEKECDILVNHVPNLTFSAGDFDKSTLIYDEGKIATEASVGQLVDLAKMLKPYKQRAHALPEVPKSVIFDTIVYKGISKENLRLVEARSGLKVKEDYTIVEGENHVNKILGTNLFKSISATQILDGDDTTLEISAIEKSHNQVKLAAHFDNTRGVGILLNYTGRNILGASSRFLVTLDVAQEPKFKVQYQKIFGNNKDWWFRSEVFGENLNQDVIIKGNSIDEMKFRYLQFDNQINRNINTLKSYAGIGLEYEHTSLKPDADPAVVNNVLNLVDYKFNTIEIYGQFVYNSLNEVFFPSEGANLEVKLGRALTNDMEVNYYDTSLDTDESGHITDFTQFRLNYQYIKSLNKKMSLILGAKIGFTFLDKSSGDDLSFQEYGYGANYYLGGDFKRPRDNDFVFSGLLENELPASQFMGVNIAFQYEFINNLYLTPHFNVGSVGFGDFNDYAEDAFSPSGEWDDNLDPSSLVSAGGKLSYNSIIGPIDLDFTWVNSTDKFRVFFAIGIPIGR